MKSNEPEKNEKQSRRKTFLKELANPIEGGQATEEGELRYAGRAKGFLILPAEFIYAGDHLSHGEYRTWIVIFKHNWDRDQACRVSWPGRERLAILLGIKKRQVTTYLNGLRRKELLKTKRRLDNTSLYLLYDPPKAWMRETKRKMRELKKRQKEQWKKRKLNQVEEFSREDVQLIAHTEVQKVAGTEVQKVAGTEVQKVAH